MHEPRSAESPRKVKGKECGCVVSIRVGVLKLAAASVHALAPVSIYTGMFAGRGLKVMRSLDFVNKQQISVCLGSC